MDNMQLLLIHCILQHPAGSTLRSFLHAVLYSMNLLFTCLLDNASCQVNPHFAEWSYAVAVEMF